MSVDIIARQSLQGDRFLATAQLPSSQQRCSPRVPALHCRERPIWYFRRYPAQVLLFWHRCMPYAVHIGNSFCIMLSEDSCWHEQSLVVGHADVVPSRQLMSPWQAHVYDGPGLLLANDNASRSSTLPDPSGVSHVACVRGRLHWSLSRRGMGTLSGAAPGFTCCLQPEGQWELR